MNTHTAKNSPRASLALPVLLLPALALLAACGSDDAADAPEGTQKIDIDAAAVGNIDTSPAAIEAARTAAAQLVGGSGAMREAPEARAVAGAMSPGAVLSKATSGAATGSNGTDCAAQAKYGDEWGDSLPATFPVYPKAQIVEAAGTNESGCNLRVINFATPVPVSDVINFYYTRAAGEGFEMQRALVESEDTLGGTLAGRNFVVIGRERVGGGSDIDLIVDGS